MRLIDAEALIEGCKLCIETINDAPTVLIARTFMKIIEKQPTVEPEIVRCEDCKHRYVDGEGVRFNVCELNHNKVQSDDWFCADAERREGEADG